MITAINYESHDQWLEIRRNYLGGSDAAAAIGMSEFTSPYALWAEKTGRAPGFAGNVATRVGTQLESLVADLWCEETGKKVRRRNAVLTNDQYPWACANVDRLVVGEKALLEIKTTSSYPVLRQIRGGEFPDRWLCQVTHYLAVTGLDRAYLAVLINCRELATFTLERDEDEIAALMAAEEVFWAHVQQDQPPALDGTASTTEAINQVFPVDEGRTVEAPDLEADFKLLEQYKQQKKFIDSQIAEAENRIKAGMGDASECLAGRYRATWKAQDRRTFDAKRYAADHPDLELDPYYKVTSTRVFRMQKL